MILYVIVIFSFAFSGYSIFVVIGDLPQCEADQLLKLCPAKPVKKPASKQAKSGAIQKTDLQAALDQVQSSSGNTNLINVF